MAEFTPPPPVVDNWRDHTNWDGPVCSECGHPLWAETSTDAGLCSAHTPYPVIHYDGPPQLVER